MQAAVGLSVVELERGRAFSYSARSRYNRRITANTPIEISGPARDHPLLEPATRRDAGRARHVRQLRGGHDAVGHLRHRGRKRRRLLRQRRSSHRSRPRRPRAPAFRLPAARQRSPWEYADPRFDAAVNPNESLKFGWIVELDPFDPAQATEKTHGARPDQARKRDYDLAGDGRAVVYMGDDQQFEYLYKFVSAGRFNPRRRAANFDLFDTGTLYVAKFFEDGTGEWLPLVFGEHPELTPARGFASQGDVALRCREAADRLGATPLDRPEDVAINPRNQNVYVVVHAKSRTATRVRPKSPAEPSIPARIP